jgi:hypothetical protein
MGQTMLRPMPRAGLIVPDVWEPSDQTLSGGARILVHSPQKF